MSDWIVELLYGGQYNEAGSVLMIHIWAGVFVAMGVASSKWFIIENLQILALWRTFSGMVINIVFNLLLIPKYGINGAAIATIFANLIAAFLFDLFNYKTRKMFYFKIRALLFLNIWRKNV